jgi:lipid-binding SYLF domain-containing protein
MFRLTSLARVWKLASGGCGSRSEPRIAGVALRAPPATRPMFRLTSLVSLLAALLWWAADAKPAAARTEEQTIRAAHEVLQQFLELQIRQIPESLLAEAHGVAIIPDVIKLGFVLGGQRGHGVVIIRERDGSWRAPLFVTITGGSIGWQVGAQSTDFMLVFKTQKSVEGLLRGKFTLGADASIAAGPVGRRAGAATDTELKAEIYSYSRSRGLFVGVSLDGSALQVDDGANAAYYGGAAPGGAPPAVPAAALKLVEIVAGLTSGPGAVVPAAGVDVRQLPAAPGPTALDLGHPAARPEQHLDTVQADLAQAATNLNPLLDESWRRYLALPAEVFERGRRPQSAAVDAALARFNAVARNPQYQMLSSRQEFHKTHQLLQALSEDLRATAGPQIALPPPPGIGPR